jgi:hypothetical protein
MERILKTQNKNKAITGTTKKLIADAAGKSKLPLPPGNAT